MPTQLAEESNALTILPICVSEAHRALQFLSSPKFKHILYGLQSCLFASKNFKKFLINNLILGGNMREIKSIYLGLQSG